MAKNLAFLDHQKWSSVCKPANAGVLWGIVVVSKFNQFYFGRGDRCQCLVWVGLAD